MPCSFVVSAGAPAEEDAGGACEDEWWAGHDEGDRCVEAECFDDAEFVSDCALVEECILTLGRKS